jgi:predicted DNA-binding transcriptional regulator AlpA
MKKSTFIHAKEVATELGVSEAHAYKMVRVMNSELKKKGFIVI